MMARFKFPVLAVILLLFGIAWFLNDLGYLTSNIPWIPVILIEIAVKPRF